MMTQEYTKPVPDVDDPDMGPFWEGTRDHLLLAQRCTACATLRFPAVPICGACLDEGSEWVGVTPAGSIWSYAIYHRAFHPGFAPDVPYVVAIVETPEGVRYPGMVIGPRDDLAVGAPVRAVFHDATERFTMVHWELLP